MEINNKFDAEMSVYLSVCPELGVFNKPTI